MDESGRTIMQIGTGWQRALAAAVIVPTAALSLPVAATFLDHPAGRENFIFPAQIGGMAAIGATVGGVMPHLFTSHTSGARGALLGAGLAVGAAVAADAVLFGLITDR